MDNNKKIPKIEKRILVNTSLISGALVIVIALVACILFWPGDEKIQNVKQDIAESENEPVTELATPNLLQNLKDQAKVMTHDLVAKPLYDIEQRIMALGHGLQTGQMKTSDIKVLASRFFNLKQTPDGQALLKAATGDLNTLFSINPATDSEAALTKARTESPAIQSTFEGVPNTDLKAAAMLLALSQIRSALGRDNQSFAGDLQLMQNLVAKDDMTTQEALKRLAPYAETGVLSPEGLKKELQAMAGEITVASLKGENVSFQEKSMAHLSNFLKIEKNGETITGTPEQKIVTQAENDLNSGDLESALKQMMQLTGPAGLSAAPWIQKAKATLTAQKIKTALTQSITAGGGFGPGQLIDNEATGILILKHDTLPALPQIPKIQAAP